MIDLSSVVVTGLGAVHAVGCGRDALAAACCSGTPRFTAVDRAAGYHLADSARLAAESAGADLGGWISPAAARRMSTPSKYAVAAARMALADAGLTLDDAGSPTAVMVSNSYGPSEFTERILAQVIEQEPLAVSPSLFTESVANAPAAQIALTCRALGPNVTVTQREAGGLIALGRGAAEIVRGRASAALVVVVDELTPLLHASLDRFRALARADADGRELPRPFDRARNGFVIADGAVALVLEPAAAVRARGGRVQARLRWGASAFDPRASAAGWSDDPDLFAAALRRAFAAGPDGAGAVDAVDAVISGASGAVVGDRLEARILRAVFGERLPPVLAPKGVLGEHGGATLAAAVLALTGASFAPLPGFADVDPELGVAPWGGGVPAPARVLISGLAGGGAGAWALLDKGEA